MPVRSIYAAEIDPFYGKARDIPLKAKYYSHLKSAQYRCQNPAMLQLCCSKGPFEILPQQEKGAPCSREDTPN
jgi:hypothetical protein